MPRTARIAIPDVPHHITQRGNNRQDIFFVDDDRRVYLSLLKEHADKYGLEILGWWRQASARIDWKQALRIPQPQEQVDQIRRNTHTGRPLASDSFISKLEKLVNKRLRPLPVGRPKKRKKKLKTGKNR